jgi:phosphopantothenoylcysteine decarboxylase/phosphopantothenate--cysteine ligase
MSRILLIISGGIAAYKALETIRLLRGEGIGVSAVMTKAAEQFVTPLSVQALTEEPLHTELFSLTEESAMGHIQLSRSADLVVVAPASANILAAMAGGHATDLATTLLLATDKPVLVAPAMNVRMWLHPATVANMATLRARGVHVVGPEVGPMACNEFGPGRLAEPPSIVAAIRGLLSDVVAPTHRLDGLRALVTSGPTHEPIDPVRYIANRSSGRQGHAIAASLAAAGAQVTLVRGPVAVPDPVGVQVLAVETAEQMLRACLSALPADIAVCAAAVADWRVATISDRKLKKTEANPGATLSLVPNPDILATLGHLPAGQRPRLVVGFAAETDNLLANAGAKLRSKGCDWIVANDVSPGTGAMGGERNTVHLITAAGTEAWPPMSKQEVAARLVGRIAESISA